MNLKNVETADLIVELLQRLGPAAYRSHQAQLDNLAFRIGVESQEATLRGRHHANR